MIPTLFVEPDLFDMEEAVPPPSFRRGLSATYGTGPGGRIGSHFRTDSETLRSKEAAVDSAIQANYINALAVSVLPFFEPTKETLGAFFFSVGGFFNDIG
jgi:hypothetical protein